MCKRFSQHRDPASYLSLLHSDAAIPIRRAESYNVAPESRALLLGHGENGIETSIARWGLQGYSETLYINASIEKPEHSGFWAKLWGQGRVIVPADGWFEWTGEPGDRQPHFVHRRDGQPLLFGGVLAKDGFVIATIPAGILDFRSSRPVQLSIEGALRWIDPATSAEDALETARLETFKRPVFNWHAVTRAVTNPEYQNPDAIAPINQLGIRRHKIR